MKQIIIAGNIGKDAELRKTQNGDPVAGFTVAVNDRKKNTTWFDVSLWGKRGEALAPHLTKGSKVCVIGDFGTREHEGKTYLMVNANEVTLMGGGQSEGQQRLAAVTGGTIDTDEIPF